ncbi:MAG TPA: PilN domain-containing protein [Nitrospiria bacterium]|nr:PilN domain-containing protein [Nitrospiria bacterium]
MAAVQPQEPEVFRTNFGSQEYARSRALAAALYVAALGGFVLAAGMGWWVSESQREAAGLEDNMVRVRQQASRLGEELRRAGFPPDDPAALDRLVKQVGGLNQIIESKALSWTALMNDLETVVPRNVSVSSIRPDLKTRKLTIDGVALTLQDVTALMTALQASGRFTDVFLQQQKATEENRTEFTIECVYRGAHA